MVEQPIWKDTYYTASTSALTYHIKVDAITGNTIFNGKAYAMPNSSGVKVNISRNCADYLNNELASFDDGSYTNAHASRTFYLLDNSNTLLETYVFSYDWSYEDNPQSITPRYATGQKVVTTTKGSASYTNTVSTQGASNYCGRFALIYLEPSGRWNSYLMEGTYTITDTFQSYTTERNYNNQSLEFGQERHINEVSTDYELNTGWLSDSDSELFAKNILRSIKVYLQDIDNNKIIPVIITDSNVERKRYKNEKSLISYTVTVEESHNKEIR